MKTYIDVETRKEGELIREGLADHEVRAFVKCVAALNRLPTRRAQIRALTYVKDLLEENDTLAATSDDEQTM